MRFSCADLSRREKGYIALCEIPWESAYSQSSRSVLCSHLKVQQKTRIYTRSSIAFRLMLAHYIGRLDLPALFLFSFRSFFPISLFPPHISFLFYIYIFLFRFICCALAREKINILYLVTCSSTTLRRIFYHLSISGDFLADSLHFSSLRFSAFHVRSVRKSQIPDRRAKSTLIIIHPASCS